MCHSPRKQNSFQSNNLHHICTVNREYVLFIFQNQSYTREKKLIQQLQEGCTCVLMPHQRQRKKQRRNINVLFIVESCASFLYNDRVWHIVLDNCLCFFCCVQIQQKHSKYTVKIKNFWFFNAGWRESTYCLLKCRFGANVFQSFDDLSHKDLLVTLLQSSTNKQVESPPSPPFTLPLYGIN